jgi:hypothetical protein
MGLTVLPRVRSLDLPQRNLGLRRAASLVIMEAMSRRAIAWLLAFPLMAAGTILAHALAYRLVFPDAAVRSDVLRESGHGYLAFTPVLLGTCSAFLLAGLAGALRRGRHGEREVPAGWQLAMLPPVAFALQEHLERLFATGHLPLGTAAGGSFLVGLALQLPFASAAVLLARLLGRAALALGRALAVPPPVASPASRSQRPPASLLLPPLAALASGQAQRGPPA